MSRKKKITGILLTVATIVEMATLPQFMGILQDKILQQAYVQKEMQTVSLRFNVSDTNMSDSFFRKIKLFRNGSLYNIYGIDSSEKIETMKQTLITELSPYYNAKLLAMDWNRAVQSFDACVSYEDELGYGIFWEIALHDYKNENSLNLYLEDETGKLLFIHYETRQINLDEKERLMWLEQLTKIYDETLALLPDIQGWAREDTFLNSKYSTEIRSFFSHTEYGEFQIEFKVNMSGFYIRYI